VARVGSEQESARNRLTTARGNVSVLENTLEHLNQNLVAICKEEGSASTDKEAATEVFDSSSLLVAQTESAKLEAGALLELAQSDVAAAKLGLESLKEIRKKLSSDALAKERQLSKIAIRKAALEELQQSYEGFDDSAKVILSHPDSLGTLAEHLDIEESAEARAQQLFGSLLELVIVESDDALGRLISSGYSGGEVSLLSLEGASSLKESKLTEGFGGTEVGKRAMSKLFSGWVEEQGLTGAIEVWRGDGFKGVVTVGGAKLKRSGLAVLGSAPTGTSTSVLSRRREIGGLTSRYEKKALEVKLANESLTLGDAELKNGRVRLSIPLKMGESIDRSFTIGIMGLFTAICVVYLPLRTGIGSLPLVSRSKTKSLFSPTPKLAMVSVIPWFRAMTST